MYVFKGRRVRRVLSQTGRVERRTANGQIQSSDGDRRGTGAGGEPGYDSLFHTFSHSHNGNRH